MLTQSPLIQDGDLVLGADGQIVMDVDIKTQATVTVGAYNCMYNLNINSGLIPYIEGIPVNGRSNGAVINLVVAAFQVLLSADLLSQLTVSVVTAVTVAQVNYITLKIQAVDQNQNQFSLSWSNANG